MSEENKAFARQWFDNFVSGNFDEQRATMAEGHLFHFPLAPVPLEPDAHIGAQQGLLAACPDLSFDLEEMVAEGDIVVTRFVLHGTFQNEFQGVPPNGAELTVRGTNMMKIVDGKNAEEWDAMDTLGLMQQMGVVPTQG